MASRSASGGRWQNYPSLWSQLQYSRARPPVDSKRRTRLLASYLPDWIVTIVLWGLFYLLNNIHGFHRQFDLNDPSIRHTYAVHERVPTWLLAVIGGVAPAVIIILIASIVGRSFWDFHSGLLGLVLSLAIANVVTQVVKESVGRPRPDLIDRCKPIEGATNAYVGLATDAVCTQIDAALLKDGFRSFPSGHSSTSFAGLVYLSLYLAGKTHLFDERGHAIKAWISLAPTVGALMVAISRTMDYRHHATDVIAGGLLGTATAYWVYRLYYPHLGHPECHKPFSPRIPRETFPPSEHPIHDGDPHQRLFASSGDQAYYGYRAGGNGQDDAMRREEQGIAAATGTVPRAAAGSKDGHGGGRSGIVMPAWNDAREGEGAVGERDVEVYPMDLESGGGGGPRRA